MYKQLRQYAVICYKDLETNDSYLAYYTYGKTLEQAKAEADRLNTEKPEFLWNGELAHCDKRIYFAQMQEEMY